MSVPIKDQNGLLSLIGSSGYANSGLIVNGNPKTIVDGSATALFDVACASGERVAGAFIYHVVASDGTDHQSMCGLVTFAAVNKSGTQTLTITNATGNDAKAVSSGTLTLSFTYVTGTNKNTVKVQPTGSLTETTYTINFTILPMSGSVTVL